MIHTKNEMTNEAIYQYQFPHVYISLLGLRMYYKLGDLLTEVYCLILSEPTNLKQVLVPPESYKEKSVMCLSPSFGWFSGNLRCSLACSSVTPISAFISTWCSPCVCVSISGFKFPLFMTPVILDEGPA